MPNYPRLPKYTLAKNMDAQQVYTELQRFSDSLTYELDIRDAEINTKPSTKVYTVVTVASIGRPTDGSIAYSASAGKFRGYVSGTGWVDFN